MYGSTTSSRIARTKSAQRYRRIDVGMHRHQGREKAEVNVIDVLSDLFILRAERHPYSFGQWPGVHRQGATGVDRDSGCQDSLHHAGQSMGERLLQEFPLETPR